MAKSIELNLSEQCRSTVVETLKKDDEQGRRWKRTADMLISEGVTYKTLSEDKDYIKTFQEEIVLLSFSLNDQALFKKPTASLSDEQKHTKRYIRQMMGAKFNRVVKYVKEAEDDAKLDDIGRGAKERTTLRQRIIRECTEMIESINKAKAVDFSAVNAVAALENVVKVVKAGFNQ